MQASIWKQTNKSTVLKIPYLRVFWASHRGESYSLTNEEFDLSGCYLALYAWRQLYSSNYTLQRNTTWRLREAERVCIYSFAMPQAITVLDPWLSIQIWNNASLFLNACVSHSHFALHMKHANPTSKLKGQRICLLTDHFRCPLHKSSSFLNASAQTHSTSQHDYEQLRFYMPPRSKSSRYILWNVTQLHNAVIIFELRGASLLSVRVNWKSGPRASSVAQEHCSLWMEYY